MPLNVQMYNRVFTIYKLWLLEFARQVFMLLWTCELKSLIVVEQAMQDLPTHTQ